MTLYDPATGEYADSRSLRRATLHAIGDPQNNISTGAKTAFRSRLVGFNPLTGTTTGGHKLYLSIDSSLNETARDLLNGRKGSVAVYNYQTGQILCMVSSPDFDPSDPPTITDGDSRYDGVYMNRVLSSTFTPGSVFKVVTTAAAIEQLPDIFERSFTCTGSVKIGGDTITCPHAHGTMDFYSAFANSCNCVYAQLAVELGGETLERYARSAGLLESHDVSGIPTAAGSFDVGADDSNVGWSGVGQYDDLLNPCSLMMLMGAIAGDGSAAEPSLIYQETSMNGLTLFDGSSSARSSIGWSADTCRTLQDMMANNVAKTYGQSQFGSLAVCAKSGTAEVGTGSPHAWFAGFLNDSEHPLAFVVLVENGGGGASTAGPIAAKVLQQAVENFDECKRRSLWVQSRPPGRELCETKQAHRTSKCLVCLVFSLCCIFQPHKASLYLTLPPARRSCPRAPRDPRASARSCSGLGLRPSGAPAPASAQTAR